MVMSGLRAIVRPPQARRAGFDNYVLEGVGVRVCSGVGVNVLAGLIVAVGVGVRVGVGVSVG